MTKKHYLFEQGILEGKVRIRDIIDGERPIVSLDETWFHPQGGGQKADRGRIGAAQVLHVAHNGANVDHFVDSIAGLAPGMEVPFEIDATWRKLNTAFHTAGHLIACVGESLAPGLRAVAGHQWPGEARVEFEASQELPPNLGVEAFNARLQLDVAAGLKVSVTSDPQMGRAVRIGNYPPIPCGGTHAESLTSVAGVKVLSMKLKSGRLRVSYDIEVAHASH